ALEMHESEAAFQAVVDPYARADFFISFGEEGVNLEEGFLTFTELPGGLLTKVGKMRAAFGKVNTLHNHVLPWTDRPMVINNLVGGEDGIDDAGISVARLINNPWMFLEATGQVFRGDSGDDFFHSSKPGDLSYVGHLRGYQDITESSNIDLGFSYSQGHNRAGIVDDVDVGRFKTKLYGFDATFRWRPLQRSIYHSFIGRTELIWSRRDQFDGLQKAMGYYLSGDYQFGRRWFVGVLGALLIAIPARAQSKLNVVATTEDLASIAREVGGDRIAIESIARGYQDPHFVEAKPSFILKLQKADLLVVVGRELEIGWLPPLIQQSRNSK